MARYVDNRSTHIVAGELNGLRVAFLTANEGVEQVELTTPWQAVTDAGGTPQLLAPETGQVQAFNHLDKGYTFPVSTPSRASSRATTTRWCCRAASPTPTSSAWSRPR